MKADFSRIPSGRDKSYLRVLYQQGRVQLDADDVEQAAIILDYLQQLGRDLIGRWGGPDPDPGSGELNRGPFAIRGTADTYTTRLPYRLSPGRYYVEGVPCRLRNALVSSEPGSPLPELPAGKTWLLYLDVWEREVHWIEDESIREVALGGADTALRSEITWRVKRHEVPETTHRAQVVDRWDVDLLPSWQPKQRGQLKVRAGDPPKEPDLCVADPDARYRGLENRFYRVEVHRSGAAGEATFKWSRDNGSVVYRLLRLEGELAFLENLGRDERSGLTVGDWVEIVDDGTEARSGDLAATKAPRPLYRVEEILARKIAVRLAVPKDVLEDDPNADLPQYDEEEAAAKHVLVRRWDHREGDPKQGVPALAGGAAVIEEGSDKDGWLTLEDGIQIQFQPPEVPNSPNTYRNADFWWFAARTATGDVEWPGERNAPEARRPVGQDHHYAPLAVAAVNANGILTIEDCRRLFPPAAVPVP
ncbi:MAG TPA: DUF6519 domain-containing protein [Thermoanaerobaculia bacterium]|nr:DUF6519 domain-containing protein [Thermoanaerobaculia bacterium]